MNILTSNARFRQRVIKKSYKVGVTEASKYYHVSRNAIYEPYEESENLDEDEGFKLEM